MDKGPFDPCNFVCTGWVERDFKSAKKSGSSPDKCPFVRLGRRRSDACLTTWTILLACHLNAGGPVCPAVVHPAKPQRHRYTLCDGALVAAQDRVVDISPATRRITTLQGRCRPTTRQQQECGVPCEGQNRAGPGSWVTDGAFADVKRMLAYRLDKSKPGASSRILHGQHSRSVRSSVENSPDETGRIVCVSPYKASPHRPCGGPLKTVNIGIGGFCGRPKSSTYGRNAAAFWACLHHLYSRPCASRD